MNSVAAREYWSAAAPAAVRAGFDQLRRRVVRRQAGPCPLGEAIAQRGDPEIPQRREPELGLQDVLGFDVAVDHAVMVRGGQRARNAHAQRQQLLQRQRTVAAQQLHIVPALEELHHNHRPVVRRQRARQHRDDERMLRQRPHRPALALKDTHRHIIGETIVQHLQRDAAIELHLIRRKHATEPTTTHLHQIRKPPNNRHTLTLTHHNNPHAPRQQQGATSRPS